MSRIANSPVFIPSGVEIKLNGQTIDVKGNNGQLSRVIHPSVKVTQKDNTLKFSTDTDKESMMMAGTMRALVNNMVIGVHTGFEKKLTIIGVGYRAKAAGKKIDLNLGFSHPVSHHVPDSITVETPSNTEIIIKGIDKQLVGQVAADIRAYRPPEPYKGKGVRYSDEHIIRKEAKKK